MCGSLETQTRADVVGTASTAFNTAAVISMDAIIEEITEDLFVNEVQSMSMTSMSLL